MQSAGKHTRPGCVHQDKRIGLDPIGLAGRKNSESLTWNIWRQGSWVLWRCADGGGPGMMNIFHPLSVAGDSNVRDDSKNSIKQYVY